MSDTSRQKGGKAWNVTQTRDGGMEGRRKTEQHTARKDCARSLFSFEITWHRLFPSQSRRSQIPKHLRLLQEAGRRQQRAQHTLIPVSFGSTALSFSSSPAPPSDTEHKRSWHSRTEQTGGDGGESSGIVSDSHQSLSTTPSPDSKGEEQQASSPSGRTETSE